MKVLGARLLASTQDYTLFPGIALSELPYLRLAGLTCIALLTDIVYDMFCGEL